MSNRPPDLTAASRTIIALLEKTEHWQPRRRWITAGLLCALVLAIEGGTPSTTSTSLLYMLVTAFAVWAIGEGRGLLLGLATVAVGSAIKHAEHRADASHLAPLNEIWNTLMRFGSSGVLALIVGALRSALALERWRASCDGLTGVLNKMTFERRMDAMVAEAAAEGRAIVLAYMDLDGFKGVNDRHGHSAGDRVLRTFAGAAQQAIRSADLFARVGGDEFVALLSVRSCDEGDQVAAMLHERLTAVLAGTGFALTCSMGALVADAGSLDASGGVLELADMLMYEVKRSGKNALRIARGGRLVPALHEAYPPSADRALDALVAEIDRADRKRGEQRRAA